MRIVYHYTTAKGLIGILEDRQIWFTDFRFLNDPSELNHPVRLALQEAQAAQVPFMRDGESDTEECHLYGEVAAEKDTYLRGMAPSFVFSLSQEPDSLTLWERYAAGGGGYAIGLDLDRLEVELSTANKGVEIKEVTCHYGDDELRAHIRASLGEMAAKFRANRAGVASGTAEIVSLSMFASGCWARILQPELFAKHKKFQGEGEIRLVVTDSERLTKKFRARGLFVQPYVELKCPTLPIREIWVGPASAPEVAELGVRALLDKGRMEVYDVVRSSIPYRSLGPLQE